MDRPASRLITAFHIDPAGHPVATLECGHTQHTRHDPPWQSRPWAATPAARAAAIGARRLECKLCLPPQLH